DILLSTYCVERPLVLVDRHAGREQSVPQLGAYRALQIDADLDIHGTQRLGRLHISELLESVVEVAVQIHISAGFYSQSDAVQVDTSKPCSQLHINACPQSDRTQDIEGELVVAVT